MLNTYADDFEKVATFVFIYIAEAHACDEWPINQLDNEIACHRTLADRQKAAIGFLKAFPLHPAFTVLLDTMDDAFNRVFASWPFRFWIVLDGKIAYKPLPHEATYDINELGRWLKSYENASF